MTAVLNRKPKNWGRQSPEPQQHTQSYSDTYFSSETRKARRQTYFSNHQSLKLLETVKHSRGNGNILECTVKHIL